MTNWTPATTTSTQYGTNPTQVVYDESGKTYDTLATYYDGNALVPPFATVWTEAT